MQSFSVFFLVLLFSLVLVYFCHSFFSPDKTKIWSPITIISLVLIYYILIPSIVGLTDYNAKSVPYQYKFYLASFIFYLCVLYAFYSNFLIRNAVFRKCNRLFTSNNVHRYALILLCIALACYIPFKGFRYTISADDAIKQVEREGFVSYFIDLISLLVAASSLSLFSIRSGKKGFVKILVFVVVVYFSLILFVVGGFRYRIVLLIIGLSTIYHIYPIVRKINLKLLLPVGLVAYLGFAIMDVARVYGTGIDLDAAGGVSLAEASVGAHENVDVCCYSIRIINDYSESYDFEYFEPLITAMLMPIPRALFPSKPDGSYLTKNEQKIIGRTGVGAVVLNYVEGFMSFGWLGVVLYGLVVGLASKIVWINYLKNRNSIGAILLLALFNGFCFQWISRGYMASAFNDFMYYVVLPFWIAIVLRLKK